MIREIVVVALALGGLSLSPLTVASAQTGYLCGFASLTDPTSDDGITQSGEIDSGPLFSADVDNPGEETASISITCTIQVGSQGATHAGGDTLARTSPTGTGVAMLAPQVISYVAPFGTPVYLCTKATVNGVTRYYDAVDDPADPADGGWQSSSGVDCSLAISQSIPGVGELDPYVCPSFTVLFPPEGVVAGFWDCSPYNSSARREGGGGGEAHADPWMIGCLDTNDGAICT